MVNVNTCRQLDWRLQGNIVISSSTRFLFSIIASINHIRTSTKSQKFQTMPPLVLVTGPSGFIGAHIFSQLLEKGYFVRGTVRSQHKTEYFTTNYPEAAKSGQMSFVIVEDMAQPGAFKNAIKGTSVRT
jgi:3-oxoacyl-ACP reductase-like protein